MKTCPDCKQSFPANHQHFYTHTRAKDGLDTYCKGCKYKRNRQYAINNPDKVKRWTRKWSQKVKREVLDYYGSICACCGVTDIEFLTLDHIQGGGRRDREQIRREGASFYRWVRDNKPDTLRVLCWNCNASLGMQGYCPHDKLCSPVI